MTQIAQPSTERCNWILIRGLARGAGHWGDFLQKLQIAFPNAKIHCVDIPGNGYLNHLKTPLKISAFIPYFIKQLIDQNFDRNQPTYGYSLSLGSMSMVEWAVQDQTLFKKIFISNTSAANFSNVFKRLSVDAMMLGVRMRSLDTPEDRELASLEVTTTLTRKQILENYKNSFKSIVDFSREHSALPKNNLRQLFAALPYKFPQNPPTDTVLMSGSKDKFVSAQCSIDIERHWHCKHIIHPEAGHDIGFQYPDWVIENLLNLTTRAD